MRGPVRRRTSTAPHRGPCRAVPGRAGPCKCRASAGRYGAVPCRAVPCRAGRVPCRAVLRDAGPGRVVPYHALPCRAVRCGAVPCRAVPCSDKAMLMFFPELNEPARPAAARPVSHDVGGLAAGGSAVRTERRGQDRRNPSMVSMIGPAGLATAGTS